jgi:hypothetical protein
VKPTFNGAALIVFESGWDEPSIRRAFLTTVTVTDQKLMEARAAETMAGSVPPAARRTLSEQFANRQSEIGRAGVHH